MAADKLLLVQQRSVCPLDIPIIQYSLIQVHDHSAKAVTPQAHRATHENGKYFICQFWSIVGSKLTTFGKAKNL